MKYRKFILLLCFVFVACSPVPEKSPVTITPLREHTSTLTSQPSETPIATDVPFVMPTSTYRAPTPLSSARYRLKHWTPELANEWIEALRKYPDSLDYNDRGYHDSSYYYAYDLPAFAERESLLRFTNSHFKEDWMWDKSYNIAQFGDDDALQSYATLIDQGLNTGAANIDQMEDWFKNHETRMKLKVSPQVGKLERYILEIKDVSDSYGGYLWVAKNQGRFSVYPLDASNYGGYGDFGASSSMGISFTAEDLNGDGIAEIITYHAHFPGSGDALTSAFDVFDVSRGVPNKLEFTPELSSISERKWDVIVENGKAVGLAFDFTFDRMICPFTIHREYRWNGKGFDETLLKYPSKQKILDEFGAECLDPLLFLLQSDLRAGKTDSLKTWDDFIAGWPYSEDPSGWYGEKILPDARDEKRFMAGLYLALAGRVADSRQEIDIIVKNPVVPNSTWIAPAKKFLDSFHVPDDLPKTCLVVGKCGELIDTDSLLKLAGTKNSQEAINFLRQVGLKVNVTDLDINGDGLIDQWINMGIDAEDMSAFLFIAAEKDKYYIASLPYYYDYAKGDKKLLKKQPAFQGSPVFTVEIDDKITVYTLKQNPESSELYALRLCDQFATMLDGLEHDLLNGTPPTSIIEEELAILPELSFACQEEPYIIGYMLGRAQYVLGLAYELLGDSTRAAENYYTVWQSYPQSPFAYMAYFKLEVAP